MRSVSNQRGKACLPQRPHGDEGPHGQRGERPTEVAGDSLDGDRLFQRKAVGAPETELV
jgi:hypothetical protein